MKTTLRLALALALLAGAPTTFAYMTPGEAFGIGIEAVPSPLTAQTAPSDIPTLPTQPSQPNSSGRVFFRNGQPVLKYTPPIPPESPTPPSEPVSSSSESAPHEAAPTETGAVDIVSASGAIPPIPELPTAETGSANAEATGGGFSAFGLLTALPLWQIILIAVAVAAVPFLLFSRRRKTSAPSILDNQPLGAPVVQQPPEESSVRLEQALKSLETSAPQVPVSSPTDLAVLPPKETPPSPPAQPPVQQTPPAEPAVQPTPPAEPIETPTSVTEQPAILTPPAETPPQA